MTHVHIIKIYVNDFINLYHVPRPISDTKFATSHHVSLVRVVLTTSPALTRGPLSIITSHGRTSR